MGQRFKRFFTADGYRVLVAGRSTPLTYEQLIAQSDVVIVIVPVRETPVIIRRILPHLRSEQLLTDFTSVKEEPVAEMMGGKASVIGCHPVFGPMADPKGQNVVLCPERPGPYLDWYQGFFENHGMSVILMDPVVHDETMAFIQGLTHFLNITFARTLQTRNVDLDQLLQVCSPVYRLFFAVLCRILSGDAELYSQIQINNRGNIPVISDFLENGTELMKLVQETDWEGVKGLFDGAADYLGDFKDEARRESNFLIEQIIRYFDRKKSGGENQ